MPSDSSTPNIAPEAREAIGIADERIGQYFQGDVALQASVARAEHLAHPAGAEDREDVVSAEAGAGRQRHVRVRGL